MSITSIESSGIAPYDVAAGMSQTEGGEDVRRREAELLLESLDDPQNESMNRMLSRKENDPILRAFRLARNLLQLALYPGAGNRNLVVDIDEQVRIIQWCLQQPLPEVQTQVDASPGVTERIQLLSGRAGHYLKKAFSFFP